MGKIKSVVFDFDGTLMDTNDVIIQSWQHTYRTLRGCEGDLQVIRDSFGEILEDSMRHLFPEVPVEEALEVYRRYQRKNFLSCIQLFPGVRSLLEELNDRGVRMALATSRLKLTTMQAVEEFDLGRYFECIVTADDVIKAKPDPQILEIVLSRMGVQPDASIMVGDTLFDILCARNAGVKSALVSWSMKLAGMTMEDFLPEERPDLILEEPLQLLQVLEQG